MANTAPEHLHFSHHIDEDGTFTPCLFSNEEKIFRRFKESPSNPKGDYFAGTSSDEIDRGISVNREKYCPNPSDVLWRNVHQPKDDLILSCEYSLQVGETIYSIYNEIIKAPPPHNLKITVNPSWTKCNVSHCDIVLIPNTSTLDRQSKRDVRFYLASLFKEIV